MWKELLGLAASDNLYVQAIEQAREMLDTDWTMYQASVDSLRNSNDGDISIDIYAKDKEVNKGERDIRRKILTHLSITGGGDLSAGLSLTTVVIDIERIGDYTKNIYDLSKRHPRKLSAGTLESDLKEVEESVTKVFQEMIQSYKSGDEELARKVMLAYKKGLSSSCQEILDSMVSGKAGDLSSEDAACLALYVHYLKRIASHSRNIISALVNPFPRIGYKEKPDAEE